MEDAEVIDSIIYKLRQMTELSKMIDIEKLSYGEAYKLSGYVNAINELNDFIIENLYSSYSGII